MRQDFDLKYLESLLLALSLLSKNICITRYSYICVRALSGFNNFVRSGMCSCEHSSCAWLRRVPACIHVSHRLRCCERREFCEVALAYLGCGWIIDSGDTSDCQGSCFCLLCTQAFLLGCSLHFGPSPTLTKTCPERLMTSVCVAHQHWPAFVALCMRILAQPHPLFEDPHRPEPPLECMHACILPYV